MINVAIMVGCSGSGKSTFVNKVLPKIKKLIPTVYSADLERLDKDGNYVYKPKENQQVHEKCRLKFTRHLIGLARHQNDKFATNSLLVVDNTATTPAEVAYYRDLAKTYGAKVEIYRMTPPGWPKIDMARNKDGKIECSAGVAKYIENCVRLNSHNVSKSVIERHLLKIVRSHKDKLIGFPGWWKITNVECFYGGFSIGTKIWSLEKE